MCSGPSSSMTAVPEATTLPSVARPIRRSNSLISDAGNPLGNTGNGRSSTSPMSSQWPVTESLPGDDSAIRPNAPSGVPCKDDAGRLTRRSSPRRRSVGTRRPTLLAMFPTVLLPSSPYSAASGNSPMPTLSRTIRMTRSSRRPPDASDEAAIVRRSALVAGVVVAHRTRGANGGDRVLEDHVIGTVVLDNDGKAVEVLDAALEIGPVHEPDLHRQPFATRVVQEHVLNVGLRGSGLRLTCLRHYGSSPWPRQLPRLHHESPRFRPRRKSTVD